MYTRRIEARERSIRTRIPANEGCVSTRTTSATLLATLVPPVMLYADIGLDEGHGVFRTVAAGNGGSLVVADEGSATSAAASHWLASSGVRLTRSEATN